MRQMVSGNGPLKAMTPIPFVARLALCADAVKAGYQVKSLLPKDEGCGEHELTEWDIQAVSSADVYFSIGLPFETNLMKAAHQRNPGLRVVSLDQGFRRIEGNPYVWMSGVHQAIMDSAVKKFFGRKNVHCGSPYFDPLMVKKILHDQPKDYVVAILHPAFAYQCEQYGVKFMFLDERKFHKEKYPEEYDLKCIGNEDEEWYAKMKESWRLHEKAAVDGIVSNGVSLILALPEQNWLGDELADMSGANVKYVNLFGGDGPLDVDSCLWDDISDHEEVKAQREARAQRERELAALSPEELLLEEIKMPKIVFYAPATMKDAATFLTQASEDFGRPDLPIEERRIVFECEDDAAQRVAPLRPECPAISTIPEVVMPKHSSLLSALRLVCEKTGCIYAIRDGCVHISLPK